MALSEIWNIVHGPVSRTPIWAERRLDSPLITVPGDVRDGATALSTATLRTRWRADIEIGAQLLDPHRRTWFVGELMEIGRRRYLDMSVATFPDAASVPIPVDETPEPINPMMPPVGYQAPLGWDIVADGDPVAVLTTATEPETTGLVATRIIAFDQIAGATGSIERGTEDSPLLGYVRRGTFAPDPDALMGGFIMVNGVKTTIVIYWPDTHDNYWAPYFVRGAYERAGVRGGR